MFDDDDQGEANPFAFPPVEPPASAGAEPAATQSAKRPDTSYDALQEMLADRPDMQRRVADLARHAGIVRDDDPLFGMLCLFEYYTRLGEAVPSAMAQAGTSAVAQVEKTVEQLVATTKMLPDQVAGTVAAKTTDMVRDQLENKHFQRVIMKVSERFIEDVTKENKSIWLRWGMALQTGVVFLSLVLGAAGGYEIAQLLGQQQLGQAQAQLQAQAAEIGRWRAWYQDWQRGRH